MNRLEIVRVIAYMLAVAARLTILPLMVICEPLIRAVLAGSALLILLSALLFRLLLDSDVPILGMLTLSAACILLLRLYYRVLQWLW